MPREVLSAEFLGALTLALVGEEEQRWGGRTRAFFRSSRRFQQVGRGVHAQHAAKRFGMLPRQAHPDRAAHRISTQQRGRQRAETFLHPRPKTVDVLRAFRHRHAGLAVGR